MTDIDVWKPKKQASPNLIIAILTTATAAIWYGLILTADINGEPVSIARLITFILTALIAGWNWRGFAHEIRKPALGSAIIWTGLTLINLASLTTANIRGSEATWVLLIATLFASILAGYFWRQTLYLGRNTNSLVPNPTTRNLDMESSN